MSFFFLFFTLVLSFFLLFFFFNDTATTEIYTLSLHDALPICLRSMLSVRWTSANFSAVCVLRTRDRTSGSRFSSRSEEHTSELQSRLHLVCRLLLEKKKNKSKNKPHILHYMRPDCESAISDVH